MQENNLISLLRQAVTRHPEHTAVFGSGFEYTYQQFDQITLRLASVLIGKGINPEDCVGICLDRGAEMVIGIFGVLKAGAAYVPADPAFPPARIQTIFSDAGVKCVITTHQHQGFLENLGYACFIPDTEPLSIEHELTELPAIRPDFIAYVLFTSGSTGIPKGVMVEHHSVVNLVRYIQDRYPLHCGDVVMLKSPYTFDGSIWELFGWLLMGGKLYVAAAGAEKDPVALLAAIKTNKVAFIFFVPAMLGVFLDYVYTVGLGQELQSLKWVSVGGEVLPVPMVKLFYKVFNGEKTRLINVYGPTETTVYATTHHCKPNVEYTKLPIGECVTNDYIYILDDTLNPVQTGEEGEICIGGEGVARGYLNRSELTAEKFIPDPYHGGLMYRTGDIGRQLPDGEFDFIGRRDFQVKLRGLRIEIGEIEHALHALPEVKEAVVVFAKDRNGDDSLVACLTLFEFAGLTPRLATEEEKKMITEGLAASLPSFMIPSEFIILTDFVLTAHGKIDRNAVPEVRNVCKEPAREIFAPSGPDGKRLFELWSTILGHGNIVADDDFFSLGGHSLKAVQLSTAVLRLFGVEVPLADFYTGMTIARMLLMIEGRKENTQTSFSPVSQEPVQKVFPLLPIQVDIWAASEADLSGITHNIQIEFRLKGMVDVSMLESALKNVLSDEPVFRSVFPVEGGLPVQKVLDEIAPFNLKFRDLSAMGTEDALAAYKAMQTDNGRVRFRLNALPLYEFYLVKFSGSGFSLLMTIHHLIFDGWSLQLFVNRLRQAFDGKITQENFLHAGEYAKWFVQNTSSEAMKADLEYWEKTLEGIPQQLTLPLKPGTSHGHGHWEGHRHWWETGRQLSEAVDRYAAGNKTTPFALFMSAFQLTLAAHSGQNDIVTGTPYAGREHPDTQEMIGFFTCLLPIRSRIEPNATVKEFVSGCNHAALGAFSHTKLSIGQIIQQLKLKSQRGIHPVYQSTMVLQNWPAVLGQFPGFTITQQEIGNNTSKIDILLNVELTGESYTCWLEYDVRLFTEQFVLRLARDINIALHAITTSPDASLRAVMDNLNAETRALWQALDTMGVHYPSDKCIYQLVDAQAHSRPDAIAVSDRQRSLTYLELVASSDAFAQGLIHNGIGPGSRVAVFLPRNVNLPALLLGVLKTGAAYVPLDPVFPPERISMILDDCTPVAIVTDSTYAGRLPDNRQEVFLMINQLTEPRNNQYILTEPNPDMPAYLIYTSGSTGKPKGVVVGHRSVVNFLVSMQRSPGMEAGQKLLAITTVTFDIAVLELFLPLITGGQCHLLTHEEALDPYLLSEVIRSEKPDLMQATPVTYRMLFAIKWEGLHSLKVLCGGEALPVGLAGQLLNTCREVWNMYGPTETTVWSTIHRVGAEDIRRTGYIQLGKPVANTRIYILNDELLPVPQGVEGELYIGGDGLAHGYHNLPQLTTARFLVDPFAGGNARMYQTGDRVKVSPDGELLYLGRSDQQAKIRGFRLELGEIESVIAATGVGECVVVLREDESGEAYLSACIQNDSGSRQQAQELREILLKKLPDYMIPTYWVWLDKFPLTPSGKIDRKALPGPGTDHRPTFSKKDQPGTESEKKLLAVWIEIFKTPDIGIDDDFFELGGNSLLALSLVVKIEEQTGTRLPLATVFSEGSIRRMARLLEKKSDSLAWQSLIRIKQGVSDRTPLFLVHAAGLNLLLYNTLVRHLDPGQPVYGLQAKGLNGVDEPFETIEEMAAHYIDEIKTIQPNGPYALAGFCIGGQIAYEMAMQLHNTGEDIRFVGLFETIASHLKFNALKQPWQSIHVAGFKMQKYIWNLREFLRQPVSGQKEFVQRKWNALTKRVKPVPQSVTQEIQIDGETTVLPAYTRKVREANDRAMARYIMKPANLKVHLFKARQQEFFILDPAYYGWDRYALKGLEIIELPGNHALIFAPPADKVFGEKLQKAMDAALTVRT
jgi:amino acid adenylation domain-containing protein